MTGFQALALFALLLAQSCVPQLPTAPAPAVAPVPTVTQTAEKIGVSVGYVYIRAGNGVVTDFLEPGEAVMIYSVRDGWCYLDRLKLHMVWCGCVSIGKDKCMEANNGKGNQTHPSGGNDQ